MALLRCPQCSNPVTADESRLGTCPGCGASLTGVLEGIARHEARPHRLTIPELEAPAWRGEVEPPQPREIRMLGWGTTRAALALSAVGFTLCGVSLAVLLLWTRASFGRGNLDEATITPALFAILLIVGAVLGVTGISMAVAVPADSRARGLATASLLFLLLSGIAVVLQMTADVQNLNVHLRNDRRRLEDLRKFRPNDVERQRREDEVPSWTPTMQRMLSYALVFSSLLANIFYTLSLWMIARHFHRPRLAMSIILYLAFTVVLQLVAILIVIAESLPGVNRPAFAALLEKETLAWSGLALFSALGVWFLVNVFLLRRQLTRALLRGDF